MKSPNQLLDQVVSLETPEGIDLDLDVAGPAVRALAWLVDLAIRWAGYLGASMLLSAFGELGQGTLLLGIFLIEWWYPVLFEVTRGTTPGKQLFGLVVCHDNGTPISWPASILRNLLRVADFLPVLYGLGLLTMMSNRNFKRLGDIVAGTLVTYKQEVEPEHEPEGSSSLAPPQPLLLTEQRAILDFAERSHTISGARSLELADLLSGLTGAKGAEGVERLHAYANWMKKGN